MRIVGVKAWYEKKTYQASFADNGTLIEWWRSLPDDGALAFRAWFDVFSPTRLGRFVVGHSWYFLLASEDPSIDGYDGPLRELTERYPEAIAKRGKLVGERRMAEVNAELAVTRYWG